MKSILKRKTSSQFNGYDRLREKIYQSFVVEKLNNTVGFVLLGSFAIVLSWITISGGLTAGTLILLFVLGVPIVFTCLLNLQVGFIIVLTVSSFIFFLPRVSGQYELPFGSLPDTLLLILFLGIFVNKENKFKTTTAYRSPIFFVILIWISFLLVQVFNPNSPSNSWPLILRGVIGFTVTYFVFTRLFNTWRYVKIFTISWLIIAFLAALYAYYQEFVGLPSYDLAWVNSSPKMIGLNFIRGR